MLLLANFYSGANSEISLKVSVSFSLFLSFAVHGLMASEGKRPQARWDTESGFLKKKTSGTFFVFDFRSYRKKIFNEMDERISRQKDQYRWHQLEVKTVKILAQNKFLVIQVQKTTLFTSFNSSVYASTLWYCHSAFHFFFVPLSLPQSRIHQDLWHFGSIFCMPATFVCYL